MPGPRRAHRAYRPDEVAFVRDNVRRLTPPQLARELGRTTHGIRNLISKRGLGNRPRRDLPSCEKELRRLCAMGHLSDAQIAGLLGLTCRETVWVWRKKLGLPAALSASEAGKRAHRKEKR